MMSSITKWISRIGRGGVNSLEEQDSRQFTTDTRKGRNSNIELLRVFCILFIIGDHFTGQSGIYESGNIEIEFFYATVTSLSRVACSIFIIISAWFSVDRDFRFRKIVHIWLTVIMYTIPIMGYLYSIGVASRTDIVHALLPIEWSPLWFAGYYIVLMFISPALNLLVKRAPKNILEFFLIIMFCIQCLYTTLTTELGFFSNDIWTLIFIYVLTGYIKVYVKKIPKVRSAFVIFGIIWFGLTLLRAVAANCSIGILSSYCETYRARLQTIPNLLMAYMAFYAFLGMKKRISNLINILASATLGIYCFHQVPVWYNYLWEQGFHATIYAQNLHGIKRMAYTLCSILAVWIIGTTIELVRTKIVALVIEDREYCVSFCGKIDAWVNGNELKADGKQIKKFLVSIVVALSVYFLLIRAYSGGAFDFIMYRGALSANNEIVDQINMSISCDDLRYENGTVTCTIVVTNHGKTIMDLSTGIYPINLGISVLDQDKNMIDQDYMHTSIKSGVFATGNNVELVLMLDNLECLEKEDYVLRFEIVQEGVSWIDTTAVYWDYEESNRKLKY